MNDSIALPPQPIHPENWPEKALQEAVRVEELARNSWNALRLPLGGRHGALLQQAQKDSENVLGTLEEHSPPSLRLSHAHALLQSASSHLKSLQAGSSG